MASLLDTIKKNLASSGTQQSAPVAGQTDRAAGLLRQKATGKAQTTTGPALSNIGEQAVAAQAGQGLAQVQQQGKLAAMDLGQRARSQTQQTEQAQTQLTQQRQSAENDFSRRATKISKELARKRGELDYQKDGAKLEELGFNLALQDQQYLHELQLEGRKNRLTNDLSFEYQLQKTIFGDMQELFGDKLSLQGMLAMNDREFETQLARLGIKDAKKAWELEKETAKTKALYGAGADAVTGIMGMTSGPTSTPDSGGNAAAGRHNQMTPGDY